MSKGARPPSWYRGEPLPTIAARFHTTEDQIQGWLAELAAEANSASVLIRPDASSDRRAWAAMLLERRNYITVSSPEEIDEEPHPDLFIFFIFFDDLAAHEFSHLVAASVEVVQPIDGVESTWHADRELIAAEGRVELPLVRETLFRWWDGKLRAIVGEG